MCALGDVDFNLEGSVPKARAMVRFQCSLRCKVRIGLWWHLGFGPVVSVTVGLN